MPHLTTVASATSTALLLTALLPSSKAWAATFFMGGSTGEFGTPVVDPSVDTEATFSVQKPDAETESFVSGEAGDGSMPNKLTFTKKSFSAIPDQIFSVGNLSYLNGQTFSGTNVSSVPISINLSLLEPTKTQQQFEYSFTFNLTPNADISTSADSLTISKNPAPQTFTLAQETYSVKVLGFSPDNGVTFIRRFQVPEDQAIDSTLFAQIKQEESIPNSPAQPTDPTDVPEPAFLSGLMVLGGTILLKKKQQLSSAGR